MARRRYQKGTLRKRGRRNSVWELQWREDYIKADGTLGRRLTTRIIGPVAGITKRQALKAAEESLRPLNLGRMRPESAVTLAEFVDRYLIPCAFPALKISTQKRYRQILNLHLLPAFGSTRLMDLTTVMLQRFVLDKMAAGLSWESVNHFRNLISKIYTGAKRWNLFAGENPACGIELPEKQDVREKHALTPTQVRSILAALAEPARTMVLLGVLTGMRVGEILALRWEDVDFLAGEIHVRRSYHRGVMGSPKTPRSRRMLPMPPELAEALRALRRASVELAFSTCRGTPLNDSNLLHRHLKPVGAKLGMPWLNWHTLRRTHATLFQQAGGSLREAQAQLGHARMATTLEDYTIPLPASQRETVGKLAGMMANDGELAKTCPPFPHATQQIQ